LILFGCFPPSLFGSDSESDDEEDRKPKKKAAPPPKKAKSSASSSSKKRRASSDRGSSAKASRSSKDDRPRRPSDSGDEYDSGDDVVRTREDDAFIDNDDDLADVMDEYNDDQKFDDERPVGEDEGDENRKQSDFFDDTLKSLKTGRGRRKMHLSVQEQEQIVQEVLYRMDKAHADDLASMAKRSPALERIKYVDEAIRVLRKLQLQPTFLDFDLLSVRECAVGSYLDGENKWVLTGDRVLCSLSKSGSSHSRTARCPTWAFAPRCSTWSHVFQVRTRGLIAVSYSLVWNLTSSFFSLSLSLSLYSHEGASQAEWLW
jgi:hypothetical protein